MMANGWKSREQIMKDYGYSEGTFGDRMRECLESPYSSAVVSDTSKYAIIIEPLYQKFLMWRSEKIRNEKSEKSGRLTRGKHDKKHKELIIKVAKLGKFMRVLKD